MDSIKDFSPRTQSDRMTVEIIELLREINKKLDKTEQISLDVPDTTPTNQEVAKKKRVKKEVKK